MIDRCLLTLNLCESNIEACHDRWIGRQIDQKEDNEKDR